MSKQQEQRPGYFVRPGLNAKSQYMSGAFDLRGVNSLLYLDSKGNVLIHKRLKNGDPSKQPIATGSVHRNESSNPNAPALLGEIRTGKGTKFDLAFWWYPDADAEHPRPYYVVRYDERPVPQGPAFGPSSF